MTQRPSTPHASKQLVVAGLVVKQGTVLLVRRKRREGKLRWNFPGGSVEPGESPRDAIAREVLEETGILCTPRRMLGARTHPDTGVEIMYWVCDWTDGEPRVKESDRQDRVRWARAAEVRKLTTSNLAAEVRRELIRIESEQRVVKAV